MMSNPIFPDDYDNNYNYRGNNNFNQFDNYPNHQNDDSQYNLNSGNTVERSLPPPPPSKKMTKKKGKRDNIKVLDPHSF